MQTPGKRARIIFAILSAAIFIVIATSLFWPVLKGLAQARQRGSSGSNAPLLMFGGFVLVMLLLVAASVRRSIRTQMKPVSSQAGPPREAKPWLARPDWAAGRVNSSDPGQTKIFGFMGVAFCGMGGLLTVLVLPKELHRGNDAALLILLFPLVGLGFLAAVAREMLARRRFGACVFEMAAIPGVLGGTLEGIIVTGKPLKLEHELHLTICCIRRVTTGSGKSRSTQEYLLWRDERILKAAADLPEPEPGRTGIPIFFKLPADQPESATASGDGVHWRLEAKAKMPGVDFSTMFYVPVFNVAGAAAAAADEADPTASLQAPIEEIRREEHSRIQVNDGPNGREFYFPPARNIGTALLATAFMLIFNGIAVATIRFHAPMVFPIAFALVGVLLLWGTFSLWFKSSRITIDSTAVQAENRWLIVSRSRQFAAGEVARFATKAGMQSGSQVFTDIRLIPRGSDEKFAAETEDSQEPQNVNQLVRARLRQAAGPSGVTIASSIAGAAKANWLVQEMNKALGRRP